MTVALQGRGGAAALRVVLRPQRGRRVAGKHPGGLKGPLRGAEGGERGPGREEGPTLRPKDKAMT